MPGILIAVVGATVVVAVSSICAERAACAVLGPLPQGLPAFAIPLDHPGDIVPVLIGGMRGGARVLRRHQRAVARLCRADRAPRSTRTRKWSASAPRTSRPDSSRAFRSAAARRARPVAEAAGARTQLTGVVGAVAIALLLVARAGPARSTCPTSALAAVVIASAIGLFEIARPAPHLPHPALGILAVDRLLRRRGGARRDSGHRPRDRDRRHRIPVGRLAAAFGRAGARGGRQGLPRHHPLSARRGGFRGWCCSAGTRRCSSPTPSCSTTACSRPRRRHRRRCAGVVVAAEPVTSVDVTAADVLVELDDDAARGGHRALLRRDEGPGQGQAEALRALQPPRREDFMPTIGEAVHAYLAANPVEWVDWQDREA